MILHIASSSVFSGSAVPPACSVQDPHVCNCAADGLAEVFKYPEAMMNGILMRSRSNTLAALANAIIRCCLIDASASLILAEAMR